MRFVKDVNDYLGRYKHILAVCIIIMLCTLSILTYQFFEQQKQIIETGGFVDGKIKCVCTQEAYDYFILNSEETEVNFSKTNIDDGNK